MNLKPLSHIRTLVFAVLAVTLISCKKGGDGFDILGSDDTNIDQLTIEQTLPDVASLVLEVGEQETFFVLAKAPSQRAISYTWRLDGSIVNSTSSYPFSATNLNIGEHEIKITVTDGIDVRERVWAVKVNGAPVITPITTGTQRVSVGYTISLSATAVDPNNDSLTYAWTLNGIPSAHLVGTTGTATLTGDVSIIGSFTVTLTVSDGTATDTQSWTAEANFFPQACNTLQTNQICTYGGGPHKGNGLAHNNTTYPLRLRPIGHAQDALGNVFISDLDNNVVWYWNRTSSDVTRVGVTINANTIRVVAGTGDAASGAAGIPALQSELNGPRGLYYNDSTDTLYIAEYSGSRVKYVNSAGIVFIGMGAAGLHTDGTLAYNHNCTNPATLSYYSGSLYVSCTGAHRVKRWDLATDLAYMVAGTGSNNVTGNGVAPISGGVGSVYGLHVDATGVYMTSLTGHNVRYINTTGVSRIFWQGNPDQVTVASGMMSTIAGSGGTGAPPVAANPLNMPMQNPSGIAVRNSGNEIYVTARSRHSILLFNNTNADIIVGGRTFVAKTAGRMNSGTGSYNGSSVVVPSAQLNEPYSISIDILDSTKILFTDYSNYRLREVDLVAERVLAIAGSGRGKSGYYGDLPLPTMDHLFNVPGGVAVDSSAGEVYFVDMSNYGVRRITRYGIISTVMGKGAGDPTIDNDFAPNLLLRTQFDATNNIMNGIEMLSNGSILQINGAGHNFRYWNRTNSDNTFFNSFIQQDRVNTIGGNYVAGVGNGAPGQQGVDTQLNFPSVVRAYGTSLFVVDSANHCIRQLASNGIMTNVLGTCGTSGDPVSQNLAASSALFNRPRDIAFDNNGNMFLSDYTNNKIRFWNRGATPVSIGAITVPAGNVATIGCFSGGTGSVSEGVLASTSRCDTPTGLAYRPGRLCYSQRGRHNVRCINLTNGTVNTVAGYPEASPRTGTTLDFAQEGVAGTQATLNNPTGIAFDTAGDLYISDSSNHVIKKLKLSP